MTAPERIWAEPGMPGYTDYPNEVYTTPYVRADLLDEAVKTLERIAHASDIYGVEANAEDQGADTLAYAHKSTCNLARATLAKLRSKP